MTREEITTKANEVVEIFFVWGINTRDSISIAQEMIKTLWRRQKEGILHGDPQKPH